MNHRHATSLAVLLLALIVAAPGHAKIWGSKMKKSTRSNVIGKVRRSARRTESSSQVRTLGGTGARFAGSGRFGTSGSSFGGSSVVYGPNGAAYLVPGNVGGFGGTRTVFTNGGVSSASVGRASFPSTVRATGPKNALEVATQRIQQSLAAGSARRASTSPRPTQARAVDPSKARFDNALSSFRSRYGFSD